MLIPHEQELELYHYDESLCSQKVRIAFAEKALPYRGHRIVPCDIAEDCQNLAPEYLAVNPKGLVPTLIHKGRPVYDSFEIIRYLDEHYPDSGERLWPQTASAREELEDWISESSLREDVDIGSTFGTAIPAVSAPFLAHLLKLQPLLKVIRKFSGHPIKERRFLFISMRLMGAPPWIIKKGLASLAKGLARIEARLAQSDGMWLLGEFSQIDITLMACFHRLEDVRLGSILHNPALPRVAAYWERLQQRPSYKEAVLDWHDPVARAGMQAAFGDADNPGLPNLLSALERETKLAA